MSTKPPPDPKKTPLGKPQPLKDAINKGVDPATQLKAAPDPWEIDFQLVDEKTEFNEENYKKLAESYNKLAEYTVKKDVLAKRQSILDEIKAIDEEVFNQEKDNQTINELQTALRTLKRVKPSATSKRDVGAVDAEEKTGPLNTQYDHVKKKFVPG